MSQKDNVTKYTCDKEFQALKACIKEVVSLLMLHVSTSCMLPVEITVFSF